MKLRYTVAFDTFSTASKKGLTAKTGKKIRGTMNNAGEKFNEPNVNGGVRRE